MYSCQICKQYARVSLKEIIRHIRDTHRHFSTPVRCGVEGCPSTATSYESLRQHTYKKHRNELIPGDHSNTVPTYQDEFCNAGDSETSAQVSRKKEAIYQQAAAVLPPQLPSSHS